MSGLAHIYQTLQKYISDHYQKEYTRSRDAAIIYTDEETQKPVEIWHSVRQISVHFGSEQEFDSLKEAGWPWQKDTPSS